jgi:hypothetical protein
MIGPGRYDDLAELLLEHSRGRGVLVVVLDGDRGSGVSMKIRPADLLTFSSVLSEVARQMVADAAEMIAKGGKPR